VSIYFTAQLCRAYCGPFIAVDAFVVVVIVINALLRVLVEKAQLFSFAGLHGRRVFSSLCLQPGRAFRHDAASGL